MDIFDQSVNSIRVFSEKGFFAEALKMVETLQKAFPEKRSDLLWEKVSIFEKSLNIREEIVSLIELFEVYDDEDAYKEIMAFCDKDNLFLNNYEDNTKWIGHFLNYYGAHKEMPDINVIYVDKSLIIAVDKKNRKFTGYKKEEIDLDTLAEGITLVEGDMFPEQIIGILERTHFTENSIGADNALYLAYLSDEWEVLLQTVRFEDYFNNERVVFLIDESGAKKCFSDIMMPFPEKSVCLHDISYIDKAIKETYMNVFNDYLERRNAIFSYYSDTDNMSEIEARILNHNPRILFWTSKYTTVLQYHCRNTMQAAKELGCDSYLLIEPDSIRRITDFKIAEVIDNFHPDVIFLLDHFRYEQCDWIPSNIIFVTWIQDPMPHILDPATKEKLTKKDILLNHIFTWDKMEELYPDLLIDAPVPGNESVYRPYELTKEELEKYSTDICFVCHASDVDRWGEEILSKQKMSEEIKDIFKELFIEYQDMAKQGLFYYSKEEFANFIRNGFLKRGWELAATGIEAMSDEMHKWLNQRVFRQTIVDWIIDAGFKNIKLWGNGWKTTPKYSEYAMGPAENGETLSKIYQASKIVIGNNVMTTAAARAWESMLSGAFYLSNVIPEEADWCDIRRIMPPGTIEYFHDREELIEKLHFYLEHDDERKRMAEIGRQEALKRMTFVALMKRVLEILPHHMD